MTREDPTESNSGLSGSQSVSPTPLGTLAPLTRALTPPPSRSTVQLILNLPADDLWALTETSDQSGPPWTMPHKVHEASPTGLLSTHPIAKINMIDGGHPSRGAGGLPLPAPYK